MEFDTRSLAQPLRRAVERSRSPLSRLDARLYMPKFRLLTLLKQFFYHLLWPLSLPVMVYVEGRQQCENQYMLNVPIGRIWIIVLLHGALFGACASFCWFSFVIAPEDRDGFDFARGFVFMVLMAHSLRCLVIATKHAYMIKHDAHRLKSKASSDWFVEMNILSWAADPSPAAVVHEIYLSALRLGLEPSSKLFYYSFRGRPPVHEANLRETVLRREVLEDVASVCPALRISEGRCPGLLICAAVMLRACKAGSRSALFWRGFLLFGSIHLTCVALSFFLNTPSLQELSKYPQGILCVLFCHIVYILSSCTSLALSYLTAASAMLFSFLFAGLFDYKRRARVLRYLDRMVQFHRSVEDKGVGKPLFSSAPQPIMCLQHDPVNISCYMHCRMILKHVGLGFQLRIQAYTIYCGVAALLLVLGFLGEYFQVIWHEVDFALGLASLMLSSAMFFLFSGIIYYGIKAEESTGLANANLLKLRTIIREAYTDAIMAVPVGAGTGPSCSTELASGVQPAMSGFAALPYVGECRQHYQYRLDQSDRLLGSAIDEFKSMAKLNPLKVFGITASTGLLQGLASVLLSIGVLCIKILFGTSTG